MSTKERDSDVKSGRITLVIDGVHHVHDFDVECLVHLKFDAKPGARESAETVLPRPRRRPYTVAELQPLIDVPCFMVFEDFRNQIHSRTDKLWNIFVDKVYGTTCQFFNFDGEIRIEKLYYIAPLLSEPPEGNPVVSPTTPPDISGGAQADIPFSREDRSVP